MDQQMIRNAVLLGGGLVIGGASGYFFTKKALERKFEQQFEEDLRTVKEAYRILRKQDEFGTPEEAAAALGVEVVAAEEPEEGYREVVETMEYAPPEETEPSPYRNHDEQAVTVASNVFLSSEVPDVDVPDPTKPYVISIEEFSEDNGYEKNCLNYFVSDDVLIDERELPIDDVDRTVGTFNLANLFGDDEGLSKDANVLYIRNERLEVDFEITRAYGSFAETILGLGTDQDDG